MLEMTGHGGSLRAGFRMAATLGRWELSQEPGAGWRVSALLRDSDPFWLSRATELRLELGQSRLRYRDVHVTPAGRHLVIQGASEQEVL